MMRNILLSLVLSFLVHGWAYGQIQLAKGFRCVLGENTPNEAFFTNGAVTFRSYPWGHDRLFGKEALKAIEEEEDHQITFRPTADGLYWATGKVTDTYVYIVVVDSAVQFTLRSAKNDKPFAAYSKWLLGQIRTNKASGRGNYFVDYRGKSCFGRRDMN